MNSNLKILNDAVEIDGTFSLTDVEVDCISRVIYGECKKITSNEIVEVIQGNLESLVMEGKPQSGTKFNEAEWLKDKSPSYIRGWNQVKEKS